MTDCRGPHPRELAGLTGSAGLTALVVEDEAVVAEANALYLERLGLTVIGIARSGREALRVLAEHPEIALVVLDMNLPDGHGLELLRRIRAAGHGADVIAVTAARDVEVVRQAVAQGVVAYVIKPFTQRSFRSKIEQYLAYRAQLDTRQAALGQSDVDAMIATLRPALHSQSLPKGLSVEMVGRVTAVLRKTDSTSAGEMAEEIGTSRVTARRYLEYLADTSVAERRTSHEGRAGRPEVRYRWR
jgi:response regulator of citrate/malate metabolism